MSVDAVATVTIKFKEERPGMGIETEVLNFSVWDTAVEVARRHQQLETVQSVNIVRI